LTMPINMEFSIQTCIQEISYSNNAQKEMQIWDSLSQILGSLSQYLRTQSGPNSMKKYSTECSNSSKPTLMFIKSSPPNFLSLIKSVSLAKNVEQRRDQIRGLRSLTNVVLDFYQFGVILLFTLNGRYDWNSTIEIQSIFESRMQKAEAVLES